MALDTAGSEYSLIALAAFRGPEMLSPVKTARLGVSELRTRPMKLVELRSLQGRCGKTEEVK